MRHAAWIPVVLVAGLAWLWRGSSAEEPARNGAPRGSVAEVGGAAPASVLIRPDTTAEATSAVAQAAAVGGDGGTVGLDGAESGWVGKVWWREGPELTGLVERLAAGGDWRGPVPLGEGSPGALACNAGRHVWLAVVYQQPAVAVRYLHVPPGRSRRAALPSPLARPRIHAFVWNEALTGRAADQPVFLYRRAVDSSEIVPMAQARTAAGYCALPGVEPGLYLVALEHGDPRNAGEACSPIQVNHPTASIDQIAFLRGRERAVRCRVQLARVAGEPAGGPTPFLVLRNLQAPARPVPLGEMTGAKWQGEAWVSPGQYALESLPGGLFELPGMEAVLEVADERSVSGLLQRAATMTKVRCLDLDADQKPFRVCVDSVDAGRGVMQDEDYVGGVHVHSLEFACGLRAGEQRLVVFGRQGVWLGPWRRLTGNEAVLDVPLRKGSMLDVVAPLPHDGADFTFVVYEGTRPRVVFGRKLLVETEAGAVPASIARVPVALGKVRVECAGADGAILAERTLEARESWSRVVFDRGQSK